MRLNKLKSKDVLYLLEEFLKNKGLYAKYPLSLKENFVINDFKQANCYAYKSCGSIIMKIDILADDTVYEFAEYSKNATDYASFMEAQLLAGECSWFLNSNGSEKEEKFELNNFCCSVIGQHEFDCPKARMAEKRVNKVKQENEKLKNLLYKSFRIIGEDRFSDEYFWEELWNDLETSQEEIDRLKIFDPRIATVATVDWDTDGEDTDDEEVNLPKEVILPVGIDEEDIADYLSDLTGFCHKGFILSQKLKSGDDLFDYEVYLNEGHKGKISDEWGAAHLYLGDKGVEYNYCLEEGGNNASAIYAKTVNPEGYYEIDYSKFVHYEVDFDNPNWEYELLKEMAKFFEEYFA